MWTIWPYEGACCWMIIAAFLLSAQDIPGEEINGTWSYEHVTWSYIQNILRHYVHQNASLEMDRPILHQAIDLLFSQLRPRSE